MANEPENLGQGQEILEQAGPADPSLRTSPVAREGDAIPSYNCWYNGKEYSNGALLCQVGEVFQCSYGVWIDQRRSC